MVRYLKIASLAVLMLLANAEETKKSPWKEKDQDGKKPRPIRNKI
jgi:hypothetical protein